MKQTKKPKIEGVKLKFKSRNEVVRLFFILFIIILLSHTVSAQGVGGILNNIGNTVYKLMQNQNFVYFLTFVFYFLILWAIWSAAARAVKIFQRGDGGIEGLNKSGRMLALSGAMLSTLGIFWATKGKTQLLTNLLDPFGIFGGLLLGVVVFMITYFGFGTQSKDKSWKRAMVVAGFAMVFAGTVSSHPNIMWWGWLIALIGLLFFLPSLFRKKKEDYEPIKTVEVPPDVDKDGEKIDKTKSGLDWSKTGRMRVQVLDSEGNPLGSVRVWANHRSNGEEIFNGITSGEGDDDNFGWTDWTEVPAGPITITCFDRGLELLKLPLSRKHGDYFYAVVKEGQDNEFKLRLRKTRDLELLVNPRKAEVQKIGYNGEEKPENLNPVDPKKLVRIVVLHKVREGLWKRMWSATIGRFKVWNTMGVSRTYYLANPNHEIEFVTLPWPYQLERYATGLTLAPKTALPPYEEIRGFWKRLFHIAGLTQFHPLPYTETSQGVTHVGIRSAHAQTVELTVWTPGFPPKKTIIEFYGQLEGERTISGRLIDETASLNNGVKETETGKEILTNPKTQGLEPQSVYALSVDGNKYPGKLEVDKTFFTIKGLPKGKYKVVAQFKKGKQVAHWMGVLGRGGKNGDNPPPPEPWIDLETHKSEDNVIIAGNQKNSRYTIEGRIIDINKAIKKNISTTESGKVIYESPKDIGYSDPSLELEVYDIEEKKAIPLLLSNIDESGRFILEVEAKLRKVIVRCKGTSFNHTTPPYGRGGNNKNDNKPPAKIIELCEDNPHEENVVIQVGIETGVIRGRVVSESKVKSLRLENASGQELNQVGEFDKEYLFGDVEKPEEIEVILCDDIGNKITTTKVNEFGFFAFTNVDPEKKYLVGVKYHQMTFFHLYGEGGRGGAGPENKKIDRTIIDLKKRSDRSEYNVVVSLETNDLTYGGIIEGKVINKLLASKEFPSPPYGTLSKPWPTGKLLYETKGIQFNKVNKAFLIIDEGGVHHIVRETEVDKEGKFSFKCVFKNDKFKVGIVYQGNFIYHDTDTDFGRGGNRGTTTPYENPYPPQEYIKLEEGYDHEQYVIVSVGPVITPPPEVKGIIEGRVINNLIALSNVSKNASGKDICENYPDLSKDIDVKKKEVILIDADTASEVPGLKATPNKNGFFTINNVPLKKKYLVCVKVEGTIIDHRKGVYGRGGKYEKDKENKPPPEIIDFNKYKVDKFVIIGITPGSEIKTKIKGKVIDGIESKKKGINKLMSGKQIFESPNTVPYTKYKVACLFVNNISDGPIMEAEIDEKGVFEFIDPPINTKNLIVGVYTPEKVFTHINSDFGRGGYGNNDTTNLSRFIELTESKREENNVIVSVEEKKEKFGKISGRIINEDKVKGKENETGQNFNNETMYPNIHEKIKQLGKKEIFVFDENHKIVKSGIFPNPANGKFVIDEVPLGAKYYVAVGDKRKYTSLTPEFGRSGKGPINEKPGELIDFTGSKTEDENVVIAIKKQEGKKKKGIIQGRVIDGIQTRTKGVAADASGKVLYKEGITYKTKFAILLKSDSSGNLVPIQVVELGNDGEFLFDDVPLNRKLWCSVFVTSGRYLHVEGTYGRGGAGPENLLLERRPIVLTARHDKEENVIVSVEPASVGKGIISGIVIDETQNLLHQKEIGITKKSTGKEINENPKVIPYTNVYNKSVYLLGRDVANNRWIRVGVTNLEENGKFTFKDVPFGIQLWIGVYDLANNRKAIYHHPIPGEQPTILGRGGHGKNDDTYNTDPIPIILANNHEYDINTVVAVPTHKPSVRYLISGRVVDLDVLEQNNVLKDSSGKYLNTEYKQIRGVPSQEVVLVDEKDNEIKRTTTDSQGFFEFTDLSPDKYKVYSETDKGKYYYFSGEYGRGGNYKDDGINKKPAKPKIELTPQDPEDRYVVIAVQLKEAPKPEKHTIIKGIVVKEKEAIEKYPDIKNATGKQMNDSRKYLPLDDCDVYVWPVDKYANFSDYLEAINSKSLTLIKAEKKDDYFIFKDIQYGTYLVYVMKDKVFTHVMPELGRGGMGPENPRRREPGLLLTSKEIIISESHPVEENVVIGTNKKDETKPSSELDMDDDVQALTHLYDELRKVSQNSNVLIEHIKELKDPLIKQEKKRFVWDKYVVFLLLILKKYLQKELYGMRYLEYKSYEDLIYKKYNNTEIPFIKQANLDKEFQKKCNKRKEAMLVVLKDIQDNVKAIDKNILDKINKLDEKYVSIKNIHENVYNNFIIWLSNKDITNIENYNVVEYFKKDLPQIPPEEIDKTLKSLEIELGNLKEELKQANYDVKNMWELTIELEDELKKKGLLENWRESRLKGETTLEAEIKSTITSTSLKTVSSTTVSTTTPSDLKKVA